MKILCPLRLPVYEQGIIRGLRQAGTHVLVVEGRPISRQLLEKTVKGFHPDLLFTYGYWHHHLRLEDLAWLCAKYRLLHVYWASDDPTHHNLTSRPIAQLADLVLTTTEELCGVYRSLGKKSAYLQFACNPELHRHLAPGNQEQHDIVLIAHNYSRYDGDAETYRTRCARMLLEPIIRNGLDLKVYGEGWGEVGLPLSISAKFTGPTVPYEQLAAVYSGAKIVLGLQNECHWATQTSCRTFEALGCRAFHLSPATRAVTNLFTPGKHLLVTHSPEETVSIARYYLDHPRERERIAVAGQAEVYQRHTYGHRASEFLEAVSEML